jgi:hypothetical protein
MSVAACATGGPAADDSGVQVIKPDMQDVSRPLSELAKLPVFQVATRAHEAEPWRGIPHKQFESAGSVVDPVVQDALGGPNIPTPITTFEGMGTGLPGFTVNSAPPDTDGDIGPNHYVQIVNSGVTIFNRSGTPLLGPVNTNTFWNGFSGACATTNDGDGVVRYDRLADRWVISQFSVNGGNGPFFQCIAVSTSPDPTGTYNRYQFTFDGFNDYPKVGLWPDAYYFTYNMFPNNTFAGARACAVDRAKLLTGAVATQQCFNTANTIGGLLASDLDGPTPPPTGTPNFLLAVNTTTTLAFFKFHVDFTTPANSTFIGPTSITVASFAELCNGGTCVVQPGTTNRLDSLADRLMNRVSYRRFSDHDALLLDHSVTAGTGGGIRWYELRNMATTPTVFQQGTYAPDSAFRWMGSMAFDQTGNVGLGFTTSSSTINPSVRYTGRLVGDALGTMGQGEATIVAGTGSQTGTLTRWGDYSSLNIDPTDDCTFWYTQEYMGASGTFNWRTRVGTFKFPTCGTVTNDFSITITPASQTVAAGSSTAYTVATAVTAGAAQTVNLSVSGLPSGVTGAFNPASVTAGSSSTLTLTAATTTGAGTTNFTVTGASASATHNASASVTVTNNNQAPTVAIASPTAGSTVSGTIPVTATASDPDGTIASVKFTLPDNTTVTLTAPPFTTTFDTTRVANGAGQTITALATDNLGATASTSVMFTIANGGGGCITNLHVDRRAQVDPGQQRHRHHVEPAGGRQRRGRHAAAVAEHHAHVPRRPGGHADLARRHAVHRQQPRRRLDRQHRHHQPGDHHVQRHAGGGDLAAQGPGSRSGRRRHAQLVVAVHQRQLQSGHALVGLGDAEPADDRQRHGVHQPDRGRDRGRLVGGQARHRGPPRLLLDPARHAGAQRRHRGGVPDRHVPVGGVQLQLRQPRRGGIRRRRVGQLDAVHRRHRCLWRYRRAQHLGRSRLT